jgi:hypothetical protein
MIKKNLGLNICLSFLILLSISGSVTSYAQSRQHRHSHRRHRRIRRPNLSEVELAVLDGVSIQTMEDPTMQLYLLAYQSPNDRPGTDQRRADQAKDYLVTTRGIVAERIVTVSCGPSRRSRLFYRFVRVGSPPPSCN